MAPVRTGLLALALLVAVALPARADITAFIGAATTPDSRRVTGIALGGGFLIVGFEFEYASAREVPEEGAPELRTGMGNVLLQTPGSIAGLQLYLTGGAGGYRERLGSDQETNVGVNTGGGVKISLAGPLRLRLDYRAFRLNGNPRHAVVHRIYAGANLGF
ncbi:MAG: hypothetical protein HOP14_09875 [Acidobacteria bacterium]|nr:hypothetical protein [Acidobacteriota bacterium]